MKSEQRKRVKERIKTLDEEHIAQASQMIADKLFDLDIYKEAKRVFVYLSFGKEVDTESIIIGTLERGKKLCIPLTKGEDMLSIALETVQGFRMNEYGIKEPTEGVEVEPDLIVMPLLAFDANKNRLGRGKGFYDRYCKNRKVPTVAIAFDVQKEEEVATESHDYSPDVIITEKEVIL